MIQPKYRWWFAAMLLKMLFLSINAMMGGIDTEWYCNQYYLITFQEENMI